MHVSQCSGLVLALSLVHTTGQISSEPFMKNIIQFTDIQKEQGYFQLWAKAQCFGRMGRVASRVCTEFMCTLREVHCLCTPLVVLYLGISKASLCQEFAYSVTNSVRWALLKQLDPINPWNKINGEAGSYSKLSSVMIKSWLILLMLRNKH